MLYFRNPGLADVRALTTIGVNVKDNATAIGHFGSGFKYAVAIVLRLGGKIRVYLGDNVYEFFATEATIRGKGFQIVHLRMPDGTEKELGFTTELGKEWEPWMAYRELRCNAVDEGGPLPSTTYIDSDHVSSETLIVVDCHELELAHANADKYFISGAPRATTEGVEIHTQLPEGDRRALYYRGIRVGEFSRPTVYRYNFTGVVRLTEDRTVRYPHEAQRDLTRGVALLHDDAVIEKILTSGNEFAEGGLDFGQVTGSLTFLDTAERLVKAGVRDLNPTLRTMLSYQRGMDPYVWVDPSVVQAKMLQKAEKFCLDMGYDTSVYEIKIVKNLGYGVLGQAFGNSIYLSDSVFNMGTKMVAGTLLEEAIHLQHGHADLTRDMQNFLVDKIVSMYEEKTGNPL